MGPIENCSVIVVIVINIGKRAFLSSELKSQYKHYNISQAKMGLDATKPVFGVSDKASFKPVSSATETS